MALDLGRRLRQRRKDKRQEDRAVVQWVKAAGGGRFIGRQQLARGFLGGRVVKSPSSTYYQLEEKLSRGFPPLLGDKDRIRRQLQLVYGVGPSTESRLREAGVVWVDELLEYDRFKESAREVVEAIAAKQVQKLSRWGASDWDLARFFRPEDFVFLDLETTGLNCTQPLFLVGVVYLDQGELRLQQFLARSFEEEEGVLAAASELLRQRPVWVSYNGRTFDEPFLNGRLCYYGAECLRPELHIDLLRHVRKTYGQLLPDCRLTTVESYLLDTVRLQDVPGYLIPQIYSRFVIEQDPVLVEEILLHNARDLKTLLRLLEVVQMAQAGCAKASV